ncbi:MAG: metallophosphoesterase [Oscillospiraceae bacterium]|nr:metallophosphoesterase [Oscillospiraceae bacterium]
MKILVVSDTHRDFGALKLAFDQNSDADMLIHLGDGEKDFEDLSDIYPNFPMVYVGGNCDYGFHDLTHVVRTRCGVKLFCCHGHTLLVKSSLDLLTALASEEQCEIALYGHTHVPFCDVVNGIYVMNPGSTSLPRGQSKASCGIIEISEIDKNRVISMNIHELYGK